MNYGFMLLVKNFYITQMTRQNMKMEFKKNKNEKNIHVASLKKTVYSFTSLNIYIHTLKIHKNLEFMISKQYEKLDNL